MTNILAGKSLRVDVVDGGLYRVAGPVAIDDTPDIPVHRMVRLFTQRDARLIREAWSDPVTGAYVFDHLKLQTYFVTAHDYLRSYNAEIKDSITPEVMP